MSSFPNAPRRSAVLASLTLSALALSLACGGNKKTDAPAQPIPPAVNLAPEITSKAPLDAKQGHAYRYVVEFKDAENQKVKFSLTSDAPSAAFDEATNTLTWTPAETEVGKALKFKLEAKDEGGATTPQEWSVTPTANAAPVIPEPPRMGAVNTPYIFDLPATDADGDAITYTLEAKPDWATLNGTKIEGKPTMQNHYGFRLVASDGIAPTKPKEWTVTVPRINNQPPVITSVAPAMEAGATEYLYPIKVSDADGDRVSLALEGEPKGATLDANTNTFKWTPQPEQEWQSHEFTIIATDEWGSKTKHPVKINLGGTVRGTNQHTYLPFDGKTGTLSEDIVPNPADMEIKALVQLADGSTQALPGTYNKADATFAIKGVPQGQYWLVCTNKTEGGVKNVILTDQKQIDLGNKIMGRKDVVVAVKDTTSLTLEMTDLGIWNKNSSLRLFDFNTRLSIDPEQYLLEKPSKTDEVFSFKLNWEKRPVFDASKGDQPVIFSMLEDEIKTAEPTLEPIVDGSNTVIKAAFKAPDTYTKFALNWKGSEFKKYINKNNVDAAHLSLEAQPGATVHGAQHAYSIWGTENLTLKDKALSKKEFILPRPGFESFINACIHFENGGTTGSIIAITPKPLTDPSDIKPLISPVQNPRLSETHLSENVENVILTPQLSWQTPALGTASGYIVEIVKRQPVEEAIQNILQARLYMGAPQEWPEGTAEEDKVIQIQIPAGILELGSDYYFKITAISNEKWTPASAPFRSKEALPYGSADALSGLISTAKPEPKPESQK